MNQIKAGKVKYRIIFSAILSVLILNSCAEKKDGEKKTTLLSNILSITANEDNGVKEILNFYGGYCEYSIGKSSSTEEGNKTFFELKLSKSDVIEKYANKVELPASNTAFLFAKHLKKEQENYDEIRVVILLNNEKEYTFKYEMEQLKTVEDRVPVMEQVIENIKNKTFLEIGNYLNNESIYKYNKTELLTNLEKVNGKFGEVQNFYTYGFKFHTFEDGMEILHISGMVIRDIQNHQFSAEFDLSAPKDELLKIDYKF